MTKVPTISVIVPVFNGERFLQTALDSISAQEYPHLEVVVIDDGSTDGTGTLLNTLQAPFHGLQQENRGPAAARNLGLAEAGGEYLAFLDADDRWAEGRLAYQVERLQQEPELDLVVGVTQQVRQDSVGRLQPTGVPWMLFHLGATLIRRSSFDRVGPFDESLRQGEDVDWFNRAREAGLNIGISNELAQYYLRHDSNITGNETERDHYFLAAMKKSLDRRRQAAGGHADLPDVQELAEFNPDKEENGT